MKHLDEGTIHAWLDGALDANEAAEVERHAAECAECAARVAEARGLIAGASRILSALDDVGAEIVPRRLPEVTRTGTRRRRTTRVVAWLAAAGVLFAVGLQARDRLGKDFGGLKTSRVDSAVAAPPASGVESTTMLTTTPAPTSGTVAGNGPITVKVAPKGSAKGAASASAKSTPMVSGGAASLETGASASANVATTERRAAAPEQTADALKARAAGAVAAAPAARAPVGAAMQRSAIVADRAVAKAQAAPDSAVRAAGVQMPSGATRLSEVTVTNAEERASEVLGRVPVCYEDPRADAPAPRVIMLDTTLVSPTASGAGAPRRLVATHGVAGEWEPSPVNGVPGSGVLVLRFVRPAALELRAQVRVDGLWVGERLLRRVGCEGVGQ